MKKLIAMMLMIASVFFISCSDDGGTEPLSKEDAQEVISNLPTEMGTQMASLAEVEGVAVMQIFMNMPFPFEDDANKSSKESSVLFNLNKYLLPQTYMDKNFTSVTKMEDPNFDFETYKGTYTYHNTPFEYWEIVPGGDKIVLNFPSDETSMDVNDAILTIYSYTETLITELDDSYTYTYYNPTSMHADLFVGSVELVDVNFTAEWTATGDNAGQPTSLDAVVYLLPFEFSGNFDVNGSSAEADFSISYNGGVIVGAGIDGTFETGELEKPINLAGYIQFMDVKVKADVDIKDIENLMDGMYEETIVYTDPQDFIDDLNEEFTAAIYVEGAKAADIEIALNQMATGEEDFPFDIVFVFADGTTQSAIPTFIALGEELDGFLGFLDGFYLKK
jgi:hypothetical protein